MSKPVVNVKRSFSRAKVAQPDIDSDTIIPPSDVKKVRKPRTKKLIEESISEEVIEEPIIIPTNHDNIDNIDNDDTNFEDIDDNFLSELNNTNFKFDDDEATATIKNENKSIIQSEKQKLSLEKQRIATEKENYKFNLLKEKEEAKLLKSTKTTKTDDDDNIYSNHPTEIMGQEKRILLNKVKQYKSLFPEQLKTFKIKINPNVVELKSYLDEMDVIVNTQNVDNFLTESILASLKLIEGTTSNFKNYNLSGLSDMLKNNKQFHTLCKTLYLKYNTFNAIPAEYQMLLLVSTTAYICKNKNSKKNETTRWKSIT